MKFYNCIYILFINLLIPEDYKKLFLKNLEIREIRSPFEVKTMKSTFTDRSEL